VTLPPARVRFRVLCYPSPRHSQDFGAQMGDKVTLMDEALKLTYESLKKVKGGEVKKVFIGLRS